MIDWLTAEIPLHHQPLADGLLQKITADGEIEWQSPCRRSVTGSWDSTFSIRSTGGDGCHSATHLQVSGNPSKFLQGHNIVGSDDLLVLMSDALRVICGIVGLKPTPEEWQGIERGFYKVTRVDINYMFELPTRSDVNAWIRGAEYASKTRHGRPQLKGGTVYWGKTSRRWAIKAYSKGDEISKRPLPEELKNTGLAQFADNKLRLELVLRAMELHELGIASAFAISKYGISKLYQDYIGRIEMTENVRLSDKQISELPHRLVSTYVHWQNGEVMTEILSKATYYRHRKELLEYGVDIMQVRPSNRSSNVIPLVRVLEAHQCLIPEWVTDAGLIHSR